MQVDTHSIHDACRCLWVRGVRKGSEGLGSPYVFPAFSVHTVDDLNS